MYVCSVSGCQNKSENSSELFYPFPTNFDLCMLWVQTCGKAEYFEDFAYGGALPFIERRICCKHFEATDFVDPNNKSLGLKYEVVPVGSFTASDIIIKKEICDTVGFDDDDDKFYTEFEETCIKTELCEANGDFLNDHDYLGGHGADESTHSLPLLIIARDKLSWKKKPAGSLSQSKFRLTWSQALENVETRAASKTAGVNINPNETEEERRKRNEENARRIAIRRASESNQDRKDRLYKNAVRAALRRSLETEDQQRERRLKNALRAAYRRSIETPQQRSERRRKDLLRSARRRREETELQARIRKYNDAVRAAFRRRNETPEQREQRKMIDVLRAARRRNMESPEQREARLKADRERAARRRLLKKLEVINHSLEDDSNYVKPSCGNFNLDIMKVEPLADSDFIDANQIDKPEFVWCP